MGHTLMYDAYLHCFISTVANCFSVALDRHADPLCAPSRHVRRLPPSTGWSDCGPADPPEVVEIRFRPTKLARHQLDSPVRQSAHLDLARPKFDPVTGH